MPDIVANSSHVHCEDIYTRPNKGMQTDQNARYAFILTADAKR